MAAIRQAGETADEDLLLGGEDISPLCRGIMQKMTVWSGFLYFSKHVQGMGPPEVRGKGQSVSLHSFAVSAFEFLFTIACLFLSRQLLTDPWKAV